MKTKVQQSRWGCVLFSWLGVLWLGCVPDALAQHQQLQGHVPAAVARLTSTGRLSATTNLYLSIGLPLRNQEVLSDLLRQIYDPASPNYRHYLTPEQFAEQFGPHPTNYQAVVNFVTAHGLKVRGTHSNRVVLDVEGSVASIEQALHVTLRTYRHPTEGRTFHAPDTEPALDLAVPVLDISGLENFTVPRPMARMQPLAPKAQATPSAGSGSGGTFLAADLRAAYVPGTTLNGTGQSVGLLQFDGYYSNDIASYIAQAGITTSVMLTNIAVDGGISTPGTGNGEVCLDIEMALAMAPGLSKIYVYEAPNSTAYWNDLLNRMATDNQAKQLSCSWSGGGVNATGEQIFRQMAAQGQSFFCASGDCDAFIGTTNACGFPTDSTNITIVGGTTLTTTGGGGSYVSEAVWNLRTTNTQAHGYWGSSGGISANYNLPIYQQGLDMTTNLGSITKRNVPDVALTAANIFGVCNNGASVTFSGTSAAAPLWAGFTALVNQRATANGQAPVGFLNPPLYAIGKGANYTNCFHDTTSGDNTWPNISNKFYAVTGYDLCTGWGTPNGTNLINALMLGPTVLGATPSNSPLTGGITVTITGISLGNGDITGVTLCGVPATLLNDNSPSQVVVSAGTALAPGVGDIVVTSSSAGATTLTNGFTYLPLAPNALAATNITVSAFWANWDAVDGATNYLLDVSLNSGFTNFVSGYSNLSVGSVATWRVTGLFSGTNYYYRLREQQAGLTSDNSTSITVSTPMPAVSANSGPSVGGNLITISGTGIGNGSDITNVTICGVAAVIQSQTADSVTVMVPTGGQGTGDIIIRSGSQGTTTIKNVYTYHPPGYIFGAFQGWSSISNLPAVRANMGAAAVNGKIYAIGGQQNNNTYVSTAYVFDPAQPTSGWTNITNLPGNRSYVAAVAVKGKLYALGGRSANNTYVNTAYVFDPLQPGLGWTSLSNLPVTRAAMGATCLNDKIYALGGYNGSYQTNAYVYDPAQSTASWSSVSSLPATRGYLAATAVNGKLYAIGGYNGSYQNTVYAYNPLLPSNGWSGVSNLPALNGYLAAASVNGSLLALGGYNSSSSYLSTVNTLDPQQTLTGWTNLSTLPATRRGLAVAQLNGDLYAIGGYNGSYWNTAYKGTYASGVTPASASRLGGTTITLTGAYLGNGDVTNVTLCGVAASILADNSPTQIVISTAASAVPTNGDVVVYSTRYGVTTRSNAFTYADALATISVQASPTNAGSVTGGGTFGVGLADMLIATASNNWLFTLWNDGVTDNPRSVTVPPTNITYTANFIKIDSVGDGIPDWWRAQYFGGTGTSTDAVSCATSDPDNDGVNNLQEYLADTDPTNATSHLALIGLAVVTNDVFITWVGGSNAWQAIECSGDLTDTNAWSDLFINAPPTPITNTWPHLGAGTATNLFYRIKAWR